MCAPKRCRTVEMVLLIVKHKTVERRGFSNGCPAAHLTHSLSCKKSTTVYQLMLYREIIALYSQTHTKHINTLCEQNVELLNVKAVGNCIH